jgi:hypothetical protein
MAEKFTEPEEPADPYQARPVEILNRGEFSLFAAALRHDSIVVIEVPHKLTKEGRELLQGMMGALFPGNKRLVLDSGMAIRVIHPAPPPED